MATFNFNDEKRSSPLAVLAARRPNSLDQFIAEPALPDAPSALELGEASTAPQDPPSLWSWLVNFKCPAPWSWWSPAYAFDYAVFGVMCIAWHICSDLTPFVRKGPVPINDPDIQQKHQPVSIVSGDMLIVVAVIVPFAAAVIFLAIVGTLLSISSRQAAASVSSSSSGSLGAGRRRVLSSSAILSFLARDLHAFAFGLLFAVGAATILTDSLKSWAGRLRPDFLDRCNWSIELQHCLGNEKKVLEGRRSFPSGHSTQSFAGLGFLSLFLARIWSRVFDVDHGSDFTFMGPRARFWRILLPVLPILLAAFVAVSRIQQNAHHPTDVLAGSTIGTIFAFASHEFFFNAQHPNMHGQ